MDYRYIIYEFKDHIGHITLNRPETNLINDALIRELDDLLLKLETELEPKVLILKGAGDCFSRGEDLEEAGSDEIVQPPPGSNPSLKKLMDGQKRRARRLEYIHNYPKPIIAQVHGACFGAGLYLAMVCDLVFAEQDAQFQDPSMRMNQMTELPLWSWLIGTKKAKEFLFFGNKIDGSEAERIGMINQALPKDRLEEEVNRHAQAIAHCPGDGLPLIKESINANLEIRGLGEAWRFLGEMQLLAQQRIPGSDEIDFYRIKDEKGIEAAINARDRRFEKWGF